MNRIAIALALVAAAAGNAFADDITIDTTPFTSTASREEVTAAYIAERDQVNAMNAEDGGAMYMAQQAPAAPLTVAGQTE